MKIHLLKTLTGLAPADTEAEAFLRKKKLGSVLSADVKEVRNYAFHRKLFALFNLAYEYFEPGEISCDYGVPEKSFERFRKDITILASYYKPVIRLDGTVRIEADSLSFSKMNQETFDKLYSNVLNVILKRIPVLKDMTAEEVDDLVNKVVEFC